MEITPEHAEIRRLHKVCQHKDAVITAAIDVIEKLVSYMSKTMPADIKETYKELIQNFKNEIG